MTQELFERWAREKVFDVETLRRIAARVGVAVKPPPVVVKALSPLQAFERAFTSERLNPPTKKP